MDRVEATPARPHAELPWTAEAKARFDALIDAQPVLLRISAAKRLRDRIERDARAAGEEHVDKQRVEASQASAAGAAA